MLAAAVQANEMDELVHTATVLQQQSLNQALRHDVRTALYRTMLEIEAQQSAEQFARDLQVSANITESKVEAD
ncbi:MAG: hypothetical protein COW13_05375 [Candidatus Omnitrophica bacterium CG12_big_fil_rev_8_21_14_0_65_50_5]|nr:MAG: hypothetical protein COW13_05375 [Candidatus Omnitrophica bacterium CG12_big_fil_rev_8_21_14_0_65_50_5]